MTVLAPASVATPTTRLCGSEVKGTMRVLKKKFRYLSPAIGCALGNSSFLLNAYCYGTSKSATVMVRWPSGCRYKCV